MSYYELEDYSEPLTNLKQWNRKPEVLEQYAVPSSDQSKAYLVRRVECLRVPFDKADVVDDQVEIWLCSCGDYRYRRWPDTEPETIENVTQCKHCNLLKHEKAEKDDPQTELTFDENETNPVRK